MPPSYDTHTWAAQRATRGETSPSGMTWITVHDGRHPGSTSNVHPYESVFSLSIKAASDFDQGVAITYCTDSSLPPRKPLSEGRCLGPNNARAISLPWRREKREESNAT